MRQTVFALLLGAVTLLGTPGGNAHASEVEAGRGAAIDASATPATVPPEDTINEFLPEDRSIGECISALPKPGCGSEARGGWRQGVVLLAILAGLTIIVWRVVVSSRRARLSRTPTATTARDGGDDDRAP